MQQRLEGGWQWQPIETAPKDGTVILVNNPIKSYSNKKYYKYPVVMAWANRYITEGRESYYWKSFNHGYPKPTHWMPLPEPPK